MEKDSNSEKPVVAAFDFDGTITYRDTTFFFLLFVAGYIRTFLYMLTKIPILTAFVLGRVSRQKAKESIFKTFLKGKSREELDALGETFAKEVLPKHVRKEAFSRIKWHQEQGHRCILISASIDTYLEPWSKLMGFKEALTSRLAVDGEGKITGKLEGLNCRKEEKVRRLQELLGSLEQYQIFAYGDSDGDKELLDAADFSYYRSMPDAGEKA